MFFWSAIPKLWVVSFALLTHAHFIEPRAAKREIWFLVTKLEFNPTRFSESRPSHCRWFDLLFLIHDHFIKPKAEKRKIPFLVTKRCQKLNPIRFSDLRSRNCGRFHLLFSINDHFTTPKAKKRKISFLVTKRGQKLNPVKFFDPRLPKCVVSFATGSDGFTNSFHAKIEISFLFWWHLLENLGF